MPKKYVAAAKTSKEVGQENAVIPVRLKRCTYDALIGIKGRLIAQRRRNVSLSESVDELVRSYYEYTRSMNLRSND